MTGLDDMGHKQNQLTLNSWRENLNHFDVRLRVRQLKTKTHCERIQSRLRCAITQQRRGWNDCKVGLSTIALYQLQFNMMEFTIKSILTRPG